MILSDWEVRIMQAVVNIHMSSTFKCAWLAVLHESMNEKYVMFHVLIFVLLHDISWHALEALFMSMFEHAQLVDHVVFTLQHDKSSCQSLVCILYFRVCDAKKCLHAQLLH